MPSGVIAKVAGSTPNRRVTYLGMSSGISWSLLKVGGSGASLSFQSGSVSTCAEALNATSVRPSHKSFSSFMRLLGQIRVVAGLRIGLKRAPGREFKIGAWHGLLL